MAEHIALLTSSPRGTPYCSAQDEAAAAWPPEVVKGGICRASGENSKVGELASRAFDFNPKTKWLDLCGASAACPAWLEYRLVPDHVGGPVVVASYSVTSANDHPERDPTAWVLEGVAAIDEHDSDADHIWQILDVQDGVNFTKRFQKIQFQVPFLTPCYRWRLRISSTRGEGAMVQLSCWTLYKAPTGPGNRCSAYLPEHSSLANLLEPPNPGLSPLSSYVWRSSYPLGISPLGSPLGVSPVRNRSMAIGSDWRHPMAVDEQFPAWVEFCVPDDRRPVVLAAYRIVAGKGTDRGEDPNWWAVEGIPAATAPNLGTRATSPPSDPDHPTNVPCWVRLHEVKDFHFGESESMHSFQLDMAVPCWRFRVRLFRPLEEQQGLRLGGVAFYSQEPVARSISEVVGVGAGQDKTSRRTPWVLANDMGIAPALLSKGRLVGGMCRASGQHSAVGEVTANAFDGNTNTKWLELEGASEDSPVWIEYSIMPDTAPVRIASYSVTSANDHPERDPASWVLEGLPYTGRTTKNRGNMPLDINWLCLDVQEDVHFKQRHQVETFCVTPRPACSAYRLRITKTAQQSCHIVQLSCLNLYVENSAITMQDIFS